MPKQPPWNILVQKKTEIIAEFTVPAHKLQKSALNSFLHALVVRYSTTTPQDMLHYYVNNTRGLPERSKFAEVQVFCEPERRMSGYFCGTWECFAKAWQSMDAEIAKWLIKEREKNRQADKKA